MKAWWGLFWLAGVLPLSSIFVAADGKLLNALSQYPNCSLGCFSAAIPKSSCLVTDDTCLCSDESLTADVGACVKGACTIKQALFTQNLTMSLCDAPIRNKFGTYEATAITLLVIATVCILQRVILKHWLKIGLGFDDWGIVLTILVVIANTVITLYGLGSNGFGRDIYTLTPEQITAFLRYFQISAVFYFIQIGLIKISLLLFYLRIFPINSVRYASWATIVFTSLLTVAFTFATIFMCRPLSYFWTQWDGEHAGKCADSNTIGVTNAIISIIIDVWMLFIPLWQLKSLKMDWKKKIGIGLMFGVGTFITIMSILRFHAMLQFGSKSQNPTWDYVTITTWSVLEVDVGIICACMPAIRSLLAHLFSSVFGTIKTGENSNISGDGQSKSRKSRKGAPISIDRHREEGHGRQSRLFSSSWRDIDEERLVELQDMEDKSSKSAVSV